MDSNTALLIKSFRKDTKQFMQEIWDESRVYIEGGEEEVEYITKMSIKYPGLTKQILKDQITNLLDYYIRYLGFSDHEEESVEEPVTFF